MAPLVLRKNENGCIVEDLAFGTGVLSRTTLAPRAATIGHRHPWPEGYYFITGRGLLKTDVCVDDVQAGDFREVAPFLHHRVQNISATGPLVFVCAWANST